MFKQSLLVAAIASLTLASPSRAYCRDALEPGVAAAESPSVQLRPDATRSAEDLLHEIVSWLASNFDLPAIEDHPNIKFASKTKLATMQAEDRAHWGSRRTTGSINWLSVGLSRFMTTSRERSSFLMTGLENHQRTNQSWFTR